jgi:hypothetical protein
MVLALIGATIAFFLVRFFVSLVVPRAMLYNAGGAVAAVLFLLVFWSKTGLFGGQPPVAVAPAPAAPIAAPIAAPAKPVAYAPLVRLSSAPGKPPQAAIDALTHAVGPAGNVFAAGSTVYVNGWAGGADKKPLSGIVIVVDHHLAYDATAQYGVLRPDVAKAFNAPAMTAIGFNGVPLPTAGLVRGPHLLEIAGLTPDKKHYWLSPAKVTFIVQ